MRTHLDALGWLHVLTGWVGLLTGASLLLLSAGAASLAMESDTRASTAVMWLLLAAGLVLITGGWLMIVTGRGLVARRPVARPTALLLAVVNLCALPFGTALGVYTLWTLLNDDARGAFGRRLRAPAAE